MARGLSGRGLQRRVVEILDRIGPAGDRMALASPGFQPQPSAYLSGGPGLFGGRGIAYSVLLGIVVIHSIARGLTLLDLPSSLRYMFMGAVLAIAVIVDPLARRSRVSQGRA